MMASSGGRLFNASGAEKNLFGPIKDKNDARSLHTGSVSRRRPSTSISRLEWPIQVTRSADAGAVAYTDTSVEKGPSCFLGTVSALLVMYFQSTCNIFESVATLEGTGF